jgi:heme A synthase
VAGPVAANFVIWSVITVLLMHGLNILTFAVSSGVLMLCGIAHFRKTADKDQQVPSIHGRSANMQFIFVGICILVFFLTVVNVSPLNLGGWLNAAILTPLVLLVVYSMARIKPKKPEAKKDSNK